MFSKEEVGEYILIYLYIDRHGVYQTYQSFFYIFRYQFIMTIMKVLPAIYHENHHISNQLSKLIYPANIMS